MNALRTLPILNRPSRPASPAPQVTTANAVGSTAPGAAPAGAALSQNRSRSLSRNLADRVTSSSAAAASGMGAGAAPVGGLTPQHTGSKKTPSPPASHPPTPLPGAGPANGDITPSAGYMDVIGTRLNEAVNKATAGVDFKQKKGIKPHTGWNLGEAVVR